MIPSPFTLVDTTPWVQVQLVLIALTSSSICITSPMCLRLPCLNHSKLMTSNLDSTRNMQTPMRPLLPASGHEAVSTSLSTASTSAGIPHHDDSACFNLNNKNYTYKPSDPDAIFDDPPWDSDQPMTWPILHLPFHKASRKCRPTHIDDLTHHVHYTGAGAAALRTLLYEELCVAETEAEKLAIAFEAYLHWPFNITRNGYWKEKSGMTESEIEAWKEAKDKDQKSVVLRKM
ncbi:hypothetical protein DE146DRAFT_213175 [Phaeosphaeria sp. MPI-PUGE-AT-0046c]|nr:hypothetical protein DE146DRAFT_213175 [Phaeosphaeria sp. MPI-PUGE-AT-0046c]